MTCDSQLATCVRWLTESLTLVEHYLPCSAQDMKLHALLHGFVRILGSGPLGIIEMWKSESLWNNLVRSGKKNTAHPEATMMHARSDVVSATEMRSENYALGPPLMVSGSARSLSNDFSPIIRACRRRLSVRPSRGEVRDVDASLKLCIHIAILFYGESRYLELWRQSKRKLYQRIQGRTAVGYAEKYLASTEDAFASDDCLPDPEAFHVVLKHWAELFWCVPV